ncbi:MAG: DUF885 domain-containing protein [Verrucomicrobiales bacterium]|nr:DUF885 domain-containing protein [Verrucomicrobiales bacterium]
MRAMRKCAGWIGLSLVLAGCVPGVVAGSAEAAFAELTARYLDQAPGLSPVQATGWGDHRFDQKLDDLSPAARERERGFLREMLNALDRVAVSDLPRAGQVDAALLREHLESGLWHLDVFQEWAWNPVQYTGLAGGSIYNLMAREFAPLPERLRSVRARLEQFPRFLEQVRSTLEPARVPRVHAETAVKQNRGVLSIIEEMVLPQLGALEPSERGELEAAIKRARTAVEAHQEWLERELLPAAKGDFRIGAELFDQRLRFALQTSLTRAEVRQRAESEYERVRLEMFRVAREVYRKEYPETEFPRRPSRAYRQAIIRAALEVAYRRLPSRDAVVETAREQLAAATEFIRRKGLVELPDDPVEIILMPEFQRGVSVAYCDSPGPLDAGQKTFYAVSPIPDDWTSEQVASFLREYNWYSLQDLTMHEAMPGHYLQLAHANRYPSKLRALLGSGTFIEGWAIYGEKMMLEAGYLEGDPLARLINLKWYLRGITNALMDQAIHCDGMTREEAMKLMLEGGFQEEREAAGKWVRAQLTSTQLSTYFVGFQEVTDLRREAEAAWGDQFTLRRFHDRVLAHGSPPVHLLRGLVLDTQGSP